MRVRRDVTCTAATRRVPRVVRGLQSENLVRLYRSTTSTSTRYLFVVLETLQYRKS